MLNPTPELLTLQRQQKDLTAIVTQYLMIAQIELERKKPDWNKVFEATDRALCNVEICRIADNGLQRLMGRAA